MRPLLLTALWLGLGVAAAQSASSTPATPAVQTSDAASRLQIGQGWSFKGQTDRGRAFGADLTLRQPSGQELEQLEASLRERLGAGKVAAAFAGVQAGQPNTDFLLVLFRQRELDLLMVMAGPSNAEPSVSGAPGELSFCVLLPGEDVGQFGGLSLRFREEGETYSVTGTVRRGGSGREETLALLRDAFAPLFGVGDCTLTRR